jgi:hypothetical protein
MATIGLARWDQNWAEACFFPVDGSMQLIWGGLAVDTASDSVPKIAILIACHGPDEPEGRLYAACLGHHDEGVAYEPRL